MFKLLYKTAEMSELSQLQFQVIQNTIQLLIDCRYMNPYASNHADNNHKDSLYQNGRYLDALARLMMFKETCFAVYTNFMSP